MIGLYYNAAGQCFPLPERSLEDLVCYMPEPEAPLVEDDEVEDE